MFFISHSSKDDLSADKVADRLEAANLSTWIDHRKGIIAGTVSWDNEIRQAILKSTAGIFIMSQSSLESDICAAECLLIRELGKPLYVINLEPCNPSDVWLYIKMIQYADISTDFDYGMTSLIDAISGKTGVHLPTALQGRITGSHIMRHYLPYLNNPLRGRERDLEWVKKALDSGGVTQIIGTGGLGKTRLSAEIVLSSAGAIWHRCSPHSRVTDLQIQVRQHLNLPENIPQQAILETLTNQPTLIVVDNAEDITSEQNEYIYFIKSLMSTGSPILLTSRKVWDAFKPHKYYTPSPLTINVAKAIALDFAESENISLTEDQAYELAQKARLYPRLIEFAVGQLHHRDFRRVIKQLVELKQNDIKEALEEMLFKSIAQMVIESGIIHQILLDCLPRLLLTFPFEAIQAIAPEELNDEDDLDDALVVLQRWHFIKKDQNAYQLTDLVRDILPIPDDEKLFDAYADFYVDRAEVIFKLPLDQWSEYEGDIANITAVGDALVIKTANGTVGNLKRTVKFANNVARYITRRMEDNKLAWLEMGLNSVVLLKTQTPDDKELLWYEARITNQIGLTWNALGNKEKALNFYAKAIVLWQTIKDKRGEATTLHNMGKVWHDLGNIERSLEFYHQALPLWQVIGYRAGEAETLNNLGRILYDLEDYNQALDYYHQSFQLSEIVNNKAGKAMTLNGIGLIRRAFGDNQEALEYFHQAFMLYREVNDKRGEGDTLYNIGMTYHDLGVLEQSLEYYQQALLLFQLVGDRYNELKCYRKMASLYDEQHKVDEAIDLTKEAIMIGKQTKHPELENLQDYLQYLIDKRKV